MLFDKDAFFEKILPQLLAAVVGAVAAIGTHLWLKPQEYQIIKIFDDRREAAKEVERGFTKFLADFNEYRNLMLARSSIDLSDSAAVAAFNARFDIIYGHFKESIRELSHSLNIAGTFFGSETADEISKFRKWYNAQDARMQEARVTAQDWPTLNDCLGWKNRIREKIKAELGV